MGEPAEISVVDHGHDFEPTELSGAAYVDEVRRLIRESFWYGNPGNIAGGEAAAESCERDLRSMIGLAGEHSDLPLAPDLQEYKDKTADYRLLECVKRFGRQTAIAGRIHTGMRYDTLTDTQKALTLTAFVREAAEVVEFFDAHYDCRAKTIRRNNPVRYLNPTEIRYGVALIEEADPEADLMNIGKLLMSLGNRGDYGRLQERMPA